MGCGRQRVKEGEMSVECEGEGKPEKGGETGAFKGFRSGGDGWGEFSISFHPFLCIFVIISRIYFVDQFVSF